MKQLYLNTESSSYNNHAHDLQELSESDIAWMNPYKKGDHVWGEKAIINH